MIMKYPIRIHSYRRIQLFFARTIFYDLMKTLIVLIGPTGVGKTELSLRLAEHFQTCIVSADSRQLYADLKIGTAAPTPEQLQRVRHYLSVHCNLPTITAPPNMKPKYCNSLRNSIPGMRLYSLPEVP